MENQKEGIMSRQRFHKILLVFLSVCCSCCILTKAVVVDGEKKPEFSPTAKQSDEKSMIDSYNTKTCGISDANSKEHEFINMAREGQFPWIVSFQIYVLQNSTKKEQNEASQENKTVTGNTRSKSVENLHFCSGSFISDKWILSAAHCFAPATIKNYLENSKLIAVAGSHKVSSNEPINRNFTIERIYLHSSFDKSMPVGFDIALVELKDRVTFSQKRIVSADESHQVAPFLNTICLPLKDKRYKFNETARLAGWGLSAEKDPTSMPTKLLTTDIVLSKTDDCIDEYVKHLKSDKPKLHKAKYDDVICASYKNTRDACQSDSGGPLMQYSNKKAVVVGIVSYGVGCATKGVPGLYTRTSAYINWIKDITLNGKNAGVGFKVIEAKEGEQKVTSTTERPGLKSSSTKAPSIRHKLHKTTASVKLESTMLPITPVTKEFKFYDQ